MDVGPQTTAALRVSRVSLAERAFVPPWSLPGECTTLTPTAFCPRPFVEPDAFFTVSPFGGGLKIRACFVPRPGVSPLKLPAASVKVHPRPTRNTHPSCWPLPGPAGPVFPPRSVGTETVPTTSHNVKRVFSPNGTYFSLFTGRRRPRASGALARHAGRGGVLSLPVRDEGCLGSRHVGARQRRAAGGRDLAGRHPLREVR